MGSHNFPGRCSRWIDATWGPVDGVRSTHWPIGLRDSGGSSLCGGHQWQHQWRLGVRTPWKPGVWGCGGLNQVDVQKCISEQWRFEYSCLKDMVTRWPVTLSPFNKKNPTVISQYHTFVDPQVVGCNAVSLPWKLYLPVGQSWGATLCNRGCWNAWKRWVEMVKWETQTRWILRKAAYVRYWWCREED